jgi:phosphonate transport system substrate-binding protein
VPVPAYTAEPLIMGVYPRTDVKANYKLFQPIANYLSKKLQREVRMDVTDDFNSFWKAVENGYYDIVHYNQYHYIISQKHFGYIVILKNEENGSPKIAGAIAVRKDSNIQSVADLKGKKIVFGGGNKAMMGYILPRYLLLQEGLGEGDYIESFAENATRAVIAATLKKDAAAQAGVTVVYASEQMHQSAEQNLRILVQSEPIAQAPWAVKKNLSAKWIAQIKQTMLTLNQTADGKTILRTARLTGIAPADDADFNPHREIAKYVFGDH